MARAEQSTVINASAEDIFSYVADLKRHGEWAQPGHKLEVEQTSEGAIGHGSTFKSIGHQFGRNEDTVSITEYLPGQHLVYESEGNAGLIRHSFELARAEGGVQLTKTFEPVKSKFPFALFLPMAMAFTVPGGLRGDLARIKEKVEGS